MKPASISSNRAFETGEPVSVDGARMTENKPTRFSGEDTSFLRALARHVKDAAADPRMAERRRHWTLHNDLKPTTPIVWLSPEGSWRELVPDAALCCVDGEARNMERELLMRLYRYEHFDDASVIETRWEVPKAIETDDWGMRAEWRRSAEALGARTFKPVLHDPADLKKLHMPVVTHDETETERRFTLSRETFGDIMDVILVGKSHMAFGLMDLFTSWHGLEETMIDMCERPAFIHDAMRLITEGFRGIVRQLEAQDLLCLNNNDTYHSSGGNGWTEELPAAGFDGHHVRPADMWASAQSQELAQVSPAMHRAFAIDYEKELLAPFPRVGYGCCEDLTRKLDDVLAIPGIRRVSISPWADVEACAARLKGSCIFSWKPQPAHLVGRFDEQAVKEYIRRTVNVCRENGCHLEMILKDTHTCENHGERFDRWASIAQNVVAEAWQGSNHG